MKRLLLALTLLASACAPRQAVEETGTPGSVTDTGIQLFADRAAYRMGDQVQLRIVNNRQRQYAFNPCTRTLERRDGNTWVVIEEQRICTMMAWLLEPGQTRHATTEIQRGLVAGTYRLAIAFSAQGTPEETIVARTSPITVTN